MLQGIPYSTGSVSSCRALPWKGSDYLEVVEPASEEIALGQEVISILPKVRELAPEVIGLAR